MIELYTPGTGFPDLEAKIAYGLAAVGLEVTDEVGIEAKPGFFIVQIDSRDERAINEAFKVLVKRLLASTHMFNELPGIQSQNLSNYLTVDEKGNLKERLLNYNLVSIFSYREPVPVFFRSDKLCHHQEVPKFGKSSDKDDVKSKGSKGSEGGLILVASTHAGKPYARNSAQTRSNTTLCEVCGYLTVIGFSKFVFQNKNGKKSITVMAIPAGRLSSNSLKTLMAAQKITRKKWLSGDIPARTVPLALMSKFTSIPDAIRNDDFTLHISVFSSERRVDEFSQQPDESTKKFISAHPQNAATVERLLEKNPAVTAINALYDALTTKTLVDISRFARLYVQETSKNNYVNLIYPKTANYLLKEVGMIPEKIINDEAINSLASTLRYFVKKRNYGYVDNIRNARYESRDFEETIAKMLREAAIRRNPKTGRDEDNEYVPMPNDEQVRRIFELASKSEGFNQVKTALAILAFTYEKEKEETQE